MSLNDVENKDNIQKIYTALVDFKNYWPSSVAHTSHKAEPEGGLFEVQTWS